MKLARVRGLVAVALIGLPSAFGQSFTNLDFESATIISTYSATIPGWTVNQGDGHTVAYNTIALDGPVVSLEGTDSGDYWTHPLAVEGRYSVFLQGGDQWTPGSTASISQSGEIPATAQSLTYWGGSPWVLSSGGMVLLGPLSATFNGHPLSWVSIGGGSNYFAWGADISPYAGQSGVLMFTASQNMGPTDFGYLLDNIQFSATPIPEPTAWSLGALGTLCLLRRARLANKRLSRRHE